MAETHAQLPWSKATDDWFQTVCRELRLKRRTDITLAEVAAHGMDRAARMTVSDRDDLRLVLDALVALHARRRRRWFG
jgi:hypothetical protein